jgi:RimJ/RimL family protein N-acetyltransferase
MRSPVLLDFPDSFETERLLIRCPHPGDGPAVNAAIVESVEHLRPWMEWAQKAPTVEETEERLRRAQCHWLERSDLPLSLWLKETGEYVGGSGLHRIDWDVPRFEIGYWCRKRLEGRGLITEAVRAITAFGFNTLGANRMEIRCDVLNVRSQAVVERAGYTLEAEFRNNGRRPDGSLRNTKIYAMIPEEFRAYYK